MADCTRAMIPQSLIDSRGRFKCDSDFLPVPDGNGKVPDLTGLTPAGYGGTIPSACGLAELGQVMTASFKMTNTSYADEYMSWQSEVFTIPNRVNSPSSMQNMCVISPACDGVYSIQGNICNNPGCSSNSTIEGNFYAGRPHNVGLFNSTIQFFFNIYKLYCCTFDRNGNVIDFDYFYYYSFTTNSSRYGFKIMDFGTIKFCTPLNFAPSGYRIGVIP